jgi:hypothetical protein
MIPHILLAIALFSASPSQPVTSQHATMPAAEAAVGDPKTWTFKNTSCSRVRVQVRNIREAWVDPGCTFTMRRPFSPAVEFVCRVYDQDGNCIGHVRGGLLSGLGSSTCTWKGSALK